MVGWLIQQEDLRLLAQGRRYLPAFSLPRRQRVPAPQLRGVQTKPPQQAPTLGLRSLRQLLDMTLQLLEGLRTKPDLRIRWVHQKPAGVRSQLPSHQTQERG